ncbi:hypothetical protein EYC98_07475 [Halieaceae bacterium IMCC14734]|uniref:Uncharacterized protein n=1 Tax=Candidatus Litorirhabdus singularis TaxID=2518993 RepID=A0ABT3TH50_9GAMM|nr:hypothetical protein [Candidatus Litorirhabdus singularis]MCX2980717.1 hypothetical protein [Candidatus Litorirhabdus singularis]
MSIRAAFKKVGDAIDDLSSLHVQTYTGSVSVDLDSLPDDVNGMDRVRDAVKAARAAGTISLVAEAFFQFDGDSYNFLSSEDVSPSALAMHTAAVESGLETRLGLAELVKGVFD